MMLYPAIRTEVIKEQMTSCLKILNSWLTVLHEGLPVVDVPGSEEMFISTMKQLSGELLVVAGTCETLAAVISGEGT